MVDPRRLVTAGAAWDAGPDAGAWVGARLAPFGASVGHAVPLGYPAYAVVTEREDGIDAALERVLDVLAPVTGDQPVHCGLWEGWGFLHDHGSDPRDAPGMGVLVAWDGADPPDAARAAEARASAREVLAGLRVERPAAAPLHLPHRAYHLWTGPLRSALALRDDAVPSLVWPDDRSWFLGAPAYTREIAVAAAPGVVAALVADPGTAARRAEPADLLDIDD